MEMRWKKCHTKQVGSLDCFYTAVDGIGIDRNLIWREGISNGRSIHFHLGIFLQCTAIVRLHHWNNMVLAVKQVVLVYPKS